MEPVALGNTRIWTDYIQKISPEQLRPQITYYPRQCGGSCAGSATGAARASLRPGWWVGGRTKDASMFAILTLYVTELAAIEFWSN